MRRWVCCLLLVSCSASTSVDLPPLVDLSGLHGGARQPANLEQVSVKALYVVPRSFGVLGLEQQDVSLIDLVGVMSEDGSLYLTDMLHDPGPAAYDFGKIARSEILLASEQGSFSRDYGRFTPSPDALLSLDRGFEIEVLVRGLREKLVFRPGYEATLYQPYRRAGTTPEPGPTGATPAGGWSDSSFNGEDGESADAGEEGAPGANGQSGKDAGQSGGRGGNGSNGGDGLEGQVGNNGGAGGNGGRGGDGGNGASGGTGLSGGVGERGEDGPVLEISVRPIYSKFYPDEQLIFMQVTASWSNRSEKKNYILHRKQRFSVASIGGRGGQGGAGGQGGQAGAGGEGGDGGDGGRGGDGARVSEGRGGDGGPGGEGGRGGHGGNGGSGGDGGRGGAGGQGGSGGEVRATVIGDADFVRDVRAFIQLESIAGEGGAGGEAGAGGFVGGGGGAGSGGNGGNGGNGGAGETSGSVGARGDDGDNGDRGSSGSSSGDSGQTGSGGPRGRPGRVSW